MALSQTQEGLDQNAETLVGQEIAETGNHTLARYTQVALSDLNGDVVGSHDTMGSDGDVPDQTEPFQVVEVCNTMDQQTRSPSQAGGNLAERYVTFGFVYIERRMQNDMTGDTIVDEAIEQAPKRLDVEKSEVELDNDCRGACPANGAVEVVQIIFPTLLPATLDERFIRLQQFSAVAGEYLYGSYWKGTDLMPGVGGDPAAHVPGRYQGHFGQGRDDRAMIERRDRGSCAPGNGRPVEYRLD